MIAALYIAMFMAALAALATWFAVERVHEGQIAILRRFGRSRKVLTPGLHVRVPIVDRIERRLNTIGRSVELKDHIVDAGQNVATCHVDGRVYYQILDARQAAPELEHLEETVTQELDRLLPEFLPQHRNDSSDIFNTALKQSLNERLRTRGILVARTQIQAA